MKSRVIVPNAIERVLPPERYIISTTDRSGRITSVNDVFLEFSLYRQNELIDVQHNIVRHPDMPRALYWLAWDTLLADEDFFAYIKNLSKDGSFYWVFAHIRPVHDAEGNISAFRSVRRGVSRNAIAKVSALYGDMCSAEAAAGAKDAIEAGLNVLKKHLASAGVSYEQMVASLAD